MHFDVSLIVCYCCFPKGIAFISYAANSKDQKNRTETKYSSKFPLSISTLGSRRLHTETVKQSANQRPYSDPCMFKALNTNMV